MKNIGLIIKQARVDQGIKQLNLAKGICSISYLSKVENNQLVPSDEILVSLLNRLSITITEVSDEEEISTFNSIKELYKKAIIYRDHKSISNEIVKIEEKRTIFKNQVYSINSVLFLSRLYLISGKEMSRVESLFEFIELHEENLTNYQKCVFNINKALKSFYTDEYLQSVEYIEQALEDQNTIVLEDWELADLYNVMAICYLVNNYNYSAIEFARKALNIYRDLLLFNRAIDCYISIGISYKRNYKYKESEENFQAAYRLLKDRGLFDFEGIITQNLGTLSAIKGDSNKAIEYFLSSMDCKKTIEGYYVTILSIIQEYSKIKSSENILKWCEKGLEMYSKAKEKNLSYYYHFKIFEAEQVGGAEFTNILIKAIKYFELKKDYRHVYKYAVLLANYYYLNKKLKNSGVYYQLASEALLLKNKLLNWEDL